eukprot:3009438-Amphidinium_carterae.1
MFVIKKCFRIPSCDHINHWKTERAKQGPERANQGTKRANQPTERANQPTERANQPTEQIKTVLHKQATYITSP